MNNIKTVKLYQQNNQESLPILNLNSSDLMELDFDDLDAVVKNYYYTFELCDANWLPINLSPFDYIQGFTQNHISQYRPSSIALVKYIHYQALLPDRGCVPTKSGNYMLKVFLDGDTSQLAFTKRFYILDSKAVVGVQILQPYNTEKFQTHQKLQFSINVARLNLVSPSQQVNVTVMQNYRWDNAIIGIQPRYIQDNVLEYDGEQDFLFPGGKEYRWADLRSFRFLSDRVASIDKNIPVNIYLRPDGSRAQSRYTFFKDLNGWFEVGTTESINPFWQGDYGNVRFTYVPEGNQPYIGRDVFLLGELTGNQTNDSSRMQFNLEKGVYEKVMLLKQGFYTYTYATKDINNPSARGEVELTDGNSWETENDYTIFVYYRSLSDRYDELVAVVTANSRTRKNGF
jgi:hypothetical protein